MARRGTWQDCPGLPQAASRAALLSQAVSSLPAWASGVPLPLRLLSGGLWAPTRDPVPHAPSWSEHVTQDFSLTPRALAGLTPLEGCVGLGLGQGISRTAAHLAPQGRLGHAARRLGSVVCACVSGALVLPGLGVAPLAFIVFSHHATTLAQASQAPRICPAPAACPRAPVTALPLRGVALRPCLGHPLRPLPCPSPGFKSWSRCSLPLLSRC